MFGFSFTARHLTGKAAKVYYRDQECDNLKGEEYRSLLHDMWRGGMTAE